MGVAEVLSVFTAPATYYVLYNGCKNSEDCVSVSAVCGLWQNHPAEGRYMHIATAGARAPHRNTVDRSGDAAARQANL
jgi:hypothetical protein